MSSNIKSHQEEFQKARDTLNLKAHLFKGEVQDIWNQAEKKWTEYEGKLKKLQENAEESREELGAALSLLKEEISESYKRIKTSIQ